VLFRECQLWWSTRRSERLKQGRSLNHRSAYLFHPLGGIVRLFEEANLSTGVEVDFPYRLWCSDLSQRVFLGVALRQAWRVDTHGGDVDCCRVRRGYHCGACCRCEGELAYGGVRVSRLWPAEGTMALVARGHGGQRVCSYVYVARRRGSGITRVRVRVSTSEREREGACVRVAVVLTECPQRPCRDEAT
jgi:hypothetical protein